MSCSFIVMFFFQAEDGIRDLVRSRGLGDVYKRQANTMPRPINRMRPVHPGEVLREEFLAPLSLSVNAVSYTHLTLPTSDLV